MENMRFVDPENHFGNVPSYFDQMLREICDTEEIQLQWVSNFWVAILQARAQTHFIIGHKFDLNPYAAGLIADDKYSTYEVLSRADLPIIEHRLIYAPRETSICAADYNSLARMEEYLAQHQNHIVIKPNNGTLGKDVVEITSFRQLPAGLKQVFRQSFSGSMCPFYEIRYEYRIIVLDGESRLVYRKERGADWRFNLDHGARASKVTDSQKRQQLTQLAVDAARALGLRFCAVDIIETVDDEILIMEINSGVMIEHYLEQKPDDYELVKAIYADAIRKMFD